MLFSNAFRKVSGWERSSKAIKFLTSVSKKSNVGNIYARNGSSKYKWRKNPKKSDMGRGFGGTEVIFYHEKTAFYNAVF